MVHAKLEALENENQLLRAENEMLKERLEKVAVFAREFLSASLEIRAASPPVPYQYPTEPTRITSRNPDMSLVVTPIFKFVFLTFVLIF
jgi:cell shape-determining protein MreC